MIAGTTRHPQCDKLLRTDMFALHWPLRTQVELGMHHPLAALYCWIDERMNERTNE